MTATIIIEIISIVTLMLLALPGTQLLWNWSARELGNSEIEKFGNSGIREFGNMEVGKVSHHSKESSIKKLSVEAAKLAASIF